LEFCLAGYSAGFSISFFGPFLAWDTVSYDLPIISFCSTDILLQLLCAALMVGTAPAGFFSG